MDIILTVLNALKIDKTVIFQFILLFVFFNIIATLLFKRVQEVLEFREGKTTKLENHAHSVYKKAEDLSAQYNAKVEKTHQESQSLAQKKKSETLKKESEILRAAEDKISAEYEERKAKINKEISDKKAVVMNEAEVLAGNLVDKLTKN